MCSIDVGLIIGILSYIPIENIYLLILIGGVIMLPVILISYVIVGKYLKKKGLTKNV